MTIAALQLWFNDSNTGASTNSIFDVDGVLVGERVGIYDPVDQQQASPNTSAHLRIMKLDVGSLLVNAEHGSWNL